MLQLCLYSHNFILHIFLKIKRAEICNRQNNIFLKNIKKYSGFFKCWREWFFFINRIIFTVWYYCIFLLNIVINFLHISQLQCKNISVAVTEFCHCYIRSLNKSYFFWCIFLSYNEFGLCILYVISALKISASRKQFLMVFEKTFHYD